MVYFAPMSEKKDHIEIVIDRQLASLCPSTSYRRPTKSEIEEIKDKTRRLEVIRFWPLRHHSPYQYIALPQKISGQPNLIEDAIIEAIDAKYTLVFRRDYKMMEYLADGFTEREVASFFGVGKGTINRAKRKIAAMRGK